MSLLQATSDGEPVDFTLESASETVESSLIDIWAAFLAHLPQLVVGFGVLVMVGVISWASRKGLVRVLRRTRLRRSLRELVGRLFHIGLWMLGLLLAAMVVFPGLTPAKALSSLGIASLAIGFAFKDIFENFFAGVLILWRFPFDNGDFIECEDIMGRVEEITIRNTLIRRPTGELLVVPNSKLFNNPVEVLTDRATRRVTVICGVAYGEDVSEAVGVIRAATEGCETVSGEKPVEVFPQALAASGVDIEVAWWTKPEPLDQRRSRGEVVEAIKAALDEAGIEIPFPYRTLTFSEPLRIEGLAEARAEAPAES